MAIDIEGIRARILEIMDDERFQEVWNQSGRNMRSGKNVDPEDRSFAVVKLIDLLAYEHYFRVGWKQMRNKPTKFEKESTEIFLKRVEMWKGFMLAKWAGSA